MRVGAADVRRVALDLEREGGLVLLGAHDLRPRGRRDFYGLTVAEARSSFQRSAATDLRSASF